MMLHLNHSNTEFGLPSLTRRTMLQAGSVSLLGLGSNHLTALQAQAEQVGSAKSIIFIFLSGGLGQHDSFDMKPQAPENIRGDFSPISTTTPGLHICEHLPQLAQRSHLWSVVRSLTHPYNEHSLGHHVMLTGRTKKPPTFQANKPMPEDWPSMASILGDRFPIQNNLPPAIVLPEQLKHRTGRVIPGQFAGQMGARRDPWFINASPYNPTTYGAYPEYEFHHARGQEQNDKLRFEAPSLTLPQELNFQRLHRRMDLLGLLEDQRKTLDRDASTQSFDRFREGAISLLTDKQMREAFDVTRADDETLDRYGRHSFGWSLLMARRLVDAGVKLVQVNLGNNETWDTHGNAFPNLKNYLFPPTDQAVSALLDDLNLAGQLDETLIVMAGEFGRTPRVFGLPQHYKLPGRDHWGRAQSVFFAGGGVQGGRVIGSTDKEGGQPAADPQTPENMAATIYEALGIPETAAWTDDFGRPHHLYYGLPIPGLLS